MTQCGKRDDQATTSAPCVAKGVTVKYRRTVGTDAATRYASRFVRSVIRDLQRMDDPSVLPFGEDSGLANVWDEICVQRQTEESLAWGVYGQTIGLLIDGRLEDTPYGMLKALWLLTPRGMEWADENETGEEPAPCVQDVADYLFDELMSLANDYTNRRIRAYCDRSYLD